MNLGIGIAVAPNGSEVYIRRANRMGIRLIARSLLSGDERVLRSWPRPAAGIDDFTGRPSLSPDGTRIATVITDDAGDVSVVLIDPASGDATTIARVRASQPEVLFWAPDQQSVLVRWQPAGGDDKSREVWRVPVSGGSAAPVEWSLGHDNHEFRVHPDGRRIVYVVSSASSTKEVRVHSGLLSATTR
jgi:Tol biopolymer transport system component